jgi:divalent metal cation (Fe/Co/Zn/Cd) transporter
LQVLVILATGSVALLADTIHNFSDALTAVPLFIAFRLSGRPPTLRYTYGYRRAEDLAGVFVIAMITLAVLRTAARQVFHRLMDAVDPMVVDSIEQTATHVAGVQRVGAVRARWVGHRLTASVAVVVDEDLTVRQGHDVAEAVHHDLLHTVRHLDDVDVHVDPCGHSGTDPHAATGNHRVT